MLFGLAAIAMFGAWFSAVYHFLCMLLFEWREVGMRKFFWPPIRDAVQTPSSTAYLVHRGKFRRGTTVFFAGWLFGVIVLAMGILVGSERIAP